MDGISYYGLSSRRFVFLILFPQLRIARGIEYICRYDDLSAIRDSETFDDLPVFFIFFFFLIPCGGRDEPENPVLSDRSRVYTITAIQI